jgi:hypothetical protein
MEAQFLDWNPFGYKSQRNRCTRFDVFSNVWVLGEDLLLIVFVRIQGRNAQRQLSCFCSEGKFLTAVEGATKSRKNYSS